MYNLQETKEFGRGLYASQNLTPGVILFTAELLVLSPSDTIKVNDTDLKYYTFKYNDEQDCLVLGDGEIFNHDDSPNVGYKLGKYADREVMFFFVLKPVEKGSQLFIDYSSDIKVDATKYTVNLTGGSL
jgi:SET domain-containing protein